MKYTPVAQKYNKVAVEKIPLDIYICDIYKPGDVAALEFQRIVSKYLLTLKNDKYGEYVLLQLSNPKSRGEMASCRVSYATSSFLFPFFAVLAKALLFQMLIAQFSVPPITRCHTSWKVKMTDNCKCESYDITWKLFDQVP